MQYKIGTVNLVNGSGIVNGNNTVFQNNINIGDSFKVAGENAIYQVSAVDPVLQQFTVTPVYAGSTKDAVRYQVGRDRTPNLGMAEINPGDEDWPYWLTQEVIRRLDTVYASVNQQKLGELQDVYVGPIEPVDPKIRFWIDTSGA